MTLPRPRRSTVFLFYSAAALAALLAIVPHARMRSGLAAAERAARGELVHSLSLTDLAICTDARYTRHPAMADLHAPFQDFPLAMEHFPSGSLLPPPPHLRRYGKH